MEEIVPLFIGVIAVFVIGSILVKAGKGAAEWSRNNSMPVVTVKAILIAKRVESRTHRSQNSSMHHIGHDPHNHHHHHMNSFDRTTSTTHTFYLTFEVIDTRERMVFKVRRRQFDLLVEDDIGDLTHQGTRYHGFTRV
mgnify:CR=1 FL=1